jgi:hypothetical protein
MIGNAGQDVGEPCARVDVVQLGRDDERVHRCRPLAAAIASCEQPCLAADRYAAQRTFGGIVGQANPPVVEEV